MSNSTWLGAAIHHAQAANAHEYDFHPSMDRYDRLQLKRLWWSCILRDRMISLGMRRPIQIRPEQHPITGTPLSHDDLQNEVHESAVYTPDVKAALNWVVIGQCEFAIIVTELLRIVYPGPEDSDQRTAPRNGASQWETLEQIRLSLWIWDDDFMTWAELEDSYIHPSVRLFVYLTSIYYQYVWLWSNPR